jgi:hypothetical protein
MIIRFQFLPMTKTELFQGCLRTWPLSTQLLLRLVSAPIDLQDSRTNAMVVTRFGRMFDAGLQRRIEFECSSQKDFFVPNVVIANAIVTAAAQWGKKQRKKKKRRKERG